MAESPAPPRPVQQATPFVRLVRQSGVYALGNIAIKASGLLLIPLYLNPALLSLQSYGLLALLEATAQIAVPLAGLGISSGLLKFTADPALGEYRRALPFTALVTSATGALAMLGVFWLLAAPLADLLLTGPEQAPFIRLLGVYIALKIVGAIPFTMVRTQERASIYVAGTLAETAVLIGGVWYNLAVRQMELEGVLWAMVWSAGAGAAILGVGMLSRIAWALHGGLIVQLVRFGAPLALAGLALPFLHVGDRYLLKWLADAEELAVYSLAAKYSGVLNMLFVQSFQLAFSVIGLKTLGASSQNISLYRRTFRHYVIWTGWAALALSLVVYDVTDWLSPEASYLRADSMVLPLSIGYIFYGISLIAVNVLYAKERTRMVAVSVAIAVVLNALLNALWIPWLGGLGAALATLAAYAALAAIIVWSGSRDIPINYSWRVLGIVLLLVVALYAVAIPSLAWDPLLRLLLRGVLILAYPACILLTGVYAREEISMGWQMVKDRLGGR